MSKIIQVVVIGAIRKNGKYLLTRRIHKNKLFNGKWQLPGGGLDFGETLETCLQREIKEETNLNIINCMLIPKVITKIREKWQGVFISFLCDSANDDQQVVLDSEASAYGWFSLKEIDALDTLNGTEEILQEAEKMRIEGINIKVGAGDRTC